MSQNIRGQRGVNLKWGLWQESLHSELTVAKMDQVLLTFEEGEASLLIQLWKSRFDDWRPEFHPSRSTSIILKLDIRGREGKE